MNTLPAPVLPTESGGRLEPLRPLDTEAVARAMAEYQKGLSAILEPFDYQTFIDRDGQQRSFVKRSGWRKIAMWFGLDLQLMNQTIERDERGLPLRAKVVARAKAPNGRCADGDGYCSAYERRFSKPENDIPATASTRAMNRAISNLVGMGQTSAEELDGSVEPTLEIPTWARSATPERIDLLRDNLAAIGLDPNSTQALITAWAKAFESIPDLIVQVARGIAAGLHHQQDTSTEEVIDDAQVVNSHTPE